MGADEGGIAARRALALAQLGSSRDRVDGYMLHPHASVSHPHHMPYPSAAVGRYLATTLMWPILEIYKTARTPYRTRHV